MNAIPLDLQRRFEQRWASRFPPAVVSIATKGVGTKATHQRLGLRGKTKEKPAGLSRRAEVPIAV
jgi:hypothetical protein